MSSSLVSSSVVFSGVLLFWRERFFSSFIACCKAVMAAGMSWISMMPVGEGVFPMMASSSLAGFSSMSKSAQAWLLNVKGMGLGLH